MHPAYSVILFTTASGAGYGLLVWLAGLAVWGAVPAAPMLGLWGLGIAFVLISAGLLSSTVHLGHPERAWRAFSQWRTSWLSREGVAAIAAFVPFVLFGLGWVILGSTSGFWSLAAVLAAALALVTVWCTGMIYQSLPTIRAWHNPLVAPIYIVLALASGAVLALLIVRAYGIEPDGFAEVTTSALALALGLKLAYWSAIDKAKPLATAGSATGLGRFGKVRVLDPAHTQPSFVMREMGYQVGRKHARRLRALVLVAGFGIAIAATLLSMIAGTLPALLLSALAVLATAFGVVVERWLFFAEAEHVVTVYFGAEAA